MTKVFSNYLSICFAAGVNRYSTLNTQFFQAFIRVFFGVRTTNFTAFIFVLAMFLVGSSALAENVSNRTYNKLEKARVLLDEGKEKDVVALLEEYLPQVQSRDDDYALVLRFLVPTLVRLGEEEKALLKLEAAYEKPAIRDSLGQVYGSLLIMHERYTDADRVLSDWLTNNESPPADAFYTRAYARFQMEKYALAEADLLKAIEIRKTPPNNWYEMLVACYFFQEKYTPAEKLIKSLIEDDPQDAKKWRLLSKIYVGQNNFEFALATLMNAAESGLLEEKDDKQIIGLHAYLGIPEISARMLADKLEKKTAERNFENLTRLAQYWLMARERDQAKSVYSEAAPLDDTGNTYQLLANLYFEDAQWDEALSSYTKAKEKGRLKEPGNVTLLYAISAIKLNRFSAAESSLESLLQDEKNASAAKYWLTQLNKERERAANKRGMGGM